MRLLRAFLSLYLFSIGTVFRAIAEDFDSEVFWEVSNWLWLKSGGIDIHRDVWKE